MFTRCIINSSSSVSMKIHINKIIPPTLNKKSLSDISTKIRGIVIEIRILIIVSLESVSY